MKFTIIALIVVVTLFLSWGTANFGCSIVAKIKKPVAIFAAAVAGALVAGLFGMFFGTVYHAVLVSIKVFGGEAGLIRDGIAVGAVLGLCSLLPGVYKLFTGKNFTHKLLPGSGDPYEDKDGDGNGGGGKLTDTQKAVIAGGLFAATRR